MQKQREHQQVLEDMFTWGNLEDLEDVIVGSTASVRIDWMEEKKKEGFFLKP